MSMNVQSAKRQMRLREWAAQIDECMQSGLPVKQWCERKGVAKKTYYYRLKRVREELLEIMEKGAAFHLAGASEPGADIGIKPSEAEPPVFAPLPMAQGKSAAATVWIGRYAVDIQNGADDAVVERILKVVSRL